uniref:Uncharacterized protein n=1 Tax=Plectus sambesii TaxID=2011161 RepID=A0A914VFT3_9BILA
MLLVGCSPRTVAVITALLFVFMDSVVGMMCKVGFDNGDFREQVCASVLANCTKFVCTLANGEKWVMRNCGVPPDKIEQTATEEQIEKSFPTSGCLPAEATCDQQSGSGRCYECYGKLCNSTERSSISSLTLFLLLLLREILYN